MITHHLVPHKISVQGCHTSPVSDQRTRQSRLVDCQTIFQGNRSTAQAWSNYLASVQTWFSSVMTWHVHRCVLVCLPYLPRNCLFQMKVEAGAWMDSTTLWTESFCKQIVRERRKWFYEQCCGTKSKSRAQNHSMDSHGLTFSILLTCPAQSLSLS